METKEIKITPPEGFCVDIENSTFECIKFKKEQPTYVEIAKELFKNKDCYFIEEDGTISINKIPPHNIDSNNGTSQKQLEKLLAINKLMNVAKYLNGDWKPNWDECEYKYSICVIDGNIQIYSCIKVNGFINYFKTKELALQAIDILGEETIRLALSTDW